MDARIPAAEGSRRIWLRVGTLVDGAGTVALRDAHLVYDRNEILYVGVSSPPADVVSEEQDAPDVELRDFTLLPGLIDAHTHLFLEGGELDPARRSAYLQQSRERLLEVALSRMERLIRLGIVAVRDAGDKDGVGLALSKLCASSERPVMPYVDSPGAAIHHRGRYGSFMAEPLEDFSSARECVEARVRAGADRIKLIATGVIDFRKGEVTAAPQMTAQEILQLVSAAKSFGKQTLAHASGDAGIEGTIEGGVDSVEHGFFIRDDQLARMRDRQIAWVPTFAPVQKQLDHAAALGWDEGVRSNLRRILDRHAASVVRARELGVMVVAGSDAGSYGVAHGLGFLYELELMERAGLSPLFVIHCATGASSGRLAFKERFGQIRPGFRPRFIVTRDSPLEGVRNLRKPKTIVFDDKVIDGGAEEDARGL